MSKGLYGLGVAVLGMVVVFVGLLILICFIKGLGAVVSRKKAEKPAAPAAPAAVPAAVQAPAAEEAPAEDEGVTPEVVAAITAAITVMMGGNASFKVQHIRRVSNASAWNRAGRQEQIYSHF